MQVLSVLQLSCSTLQVYVCLDASNPMQMIWLLHVRAHDGELSLIASHAFSCSACMQTLHCTFKAPAMIHMPILGANGQMRPHVGNVRLSSLSLPALKPRSAAVLAHPLSMSCALGCRFWLLSASCLSCLTGQSESPIEWPNKTWCLPGCLVLL